MDERTAILSRMFIVLGFILLIPCVLGFQLVRINYFEGDEHRELWSKQAIEMLPIPAERGNIYDENGTLLVTNAIDYKLALDPKVHGITAEQINLLTEKLGEITKKTDKHFKNKIDSAPAHSRYIVLANNLSVSQKDQIKALDIDGVILEKNYRRKYTFNTLAAHVLGFVNYNMDGRIGLEAQYNEQLKGEDGLRQVRRDPFNRIFEYVGAPKKLPKNGHSLYTTIDSYLQAILEDELQAGVEKHQANYGTGIILDPKTGAVKALANYPTFNPNFPGSKENENRRNYAISDIIEPGSTFKLVTAIAAVEQDVVDFNEVFETPDNGVRIIHGLELRDHDPLGDLTFKEVIQKSSNVATAEIAMRLKPEIFYQYARNLGFGTPTNIDLIGEEGGRLAKPYDWSLVTLPWMSHGYEVQVTPIQLAQAYASFANKGKMMRPYIVERVEDFQGNIVTQHNPIEIREIASTSTLEKLLPVFESVVSDSGTGYLAQVEGLAIAGKTGTAKKVLNGHYINRYRGSFVGFFPVDDPKYVCLIILDEPKTSFYGGVTAGPIFQNVATRIAGLDSDIQRKINTPENQIRQTIKTPSLEGLASAQAKEILNSMNLAFSVLGKAGFVAEQHPEAGKPVKSGEKISIILSETYTPADGASNNDSFAKIPDLIGKNMRQASTLLGKIGLKTTFIGSGTIFAQFPKPGELLRTGSAVTVRGRAKSMELLTGTGS